MNDTPFPVVICHFYVDLKSTIIILKWKWNYLHRSFISLLQCQLRHLLRKNQEKREEVVNQVRHRDIYRKTWMLHILGKTKYCTWNLILKIQQSGSDISCFQTACVCGQTSYVCYQMLFVMLEVLLSTEVNMTSFLTSCLAVRRKTSRQTTPKQSRQSADSGNAWQEGVVFRKSRGDIMMLFRVKHALCHNF